MPWVKITGYACDDCCNAEATETRYSQKYRRSIGLCKPCYDYIWKYAKKESEKYSEFKDASEAAKIFERDGSCKLFDDHVDTLARKVILREQQQWQKSALPSQSRS